MKYIPKTLFLACAILLSAAPALTAKNLAQPVKSQAFTDRSDYFMCRKKIVDKLQKKSTSKAVIQKLLVSCRDQFPGTAAFIDCKKEAAQQFRTDKQKMFVAMNECKSEYKKYGFDPLSPVPIFLGQNEAYFAGAGLNMMRRIEVPPKDGQQDTPTETAPKTDSTDLPVTRKPNDFGNFSCDPLLETIQGTRPPEYLLVGNHPNAFTPIADLTMEKLRKILKITQSGKRPAPVADTPVKTKIFGEIYQAQSDSEISVFFPTSFCYFENRLSNLYEGIKLYYLVDESRKLAMPYFGIAFYRQDARVAVGTIIKKLAATLGPGFKQTVTKQGVHYFTRVPLLEFDEEGDPSNLCKDPRPHDYLALLKETQQPVKGAQFLIFANIHNLCTFGDMISKKLVK